MPSVSAIAVGAAFDGGRAQAARPRPDLVRPAMLRNLRPLSAVVLEIPPHRFILAFEASYSGVFATVAPNRSPSTLIPRPVPGSP